LVKAATLELERATSQVEVEVNVYKCPGYQMFLTVDLLLENGLRVSRRTMVEAAPHDPAHERKSTRAI
jgi:hypothetical protein